MATPKKEVQPKAATKRVRKGALVLPTYSLKQFKTGDAFTVMIQSEIADKPDFDNKTGERKLDNKTKEPAFIHTVNVTDMDTGAIGEMVLPCIIHNALAIAGELTGRAFEFVKGEEKTGGATKWEVYEVEA
jgi:hypothetical protein